MTERNQKNDRAELGEQSNTQETHMGRTNIERSDRTMGAGASGDRMAGSEGIDDPMTEQGRQQGRESTDDADSFSGQGAQREGSPRPDGTGYTGSSKRTGESSNTDENESENPLS